MQTHQSIRSVIVSEAERQNLTAYAIAKSADLDPGIVKRYFNGDRDATGETLDKVCEVLKLELRPAKRKAKVKP